jgi:hypothetical protein
MWPSSGSRERGGVDVKTYYEILGVGTQASPEEIKRSYHREIARCHPDKVLHLGPEFQQLAAARSTELTQAYSVLIDGGRRQEYDRQMRVLRVTATVPAGGPLAVDPDALPDSRRDILRKAAIDRLRDAVAEDDATSEPVHAQGFDLAVLVRPRRTIFQRTPGSGLLVLGRYLPSADAVAVSESWRLAAAVFAEPGTSRVAFLLARDLAGRVELGAAINEQRRRSRGTPVLIVPVSVGDWNVLVPTDAPPQVRSIVERLRSRGSR